MMKSHETISSKDNATLKRVRRLLRSRSYRAENSAFVMEGLNCAEALFGGQTRYTPEVLLLSQSFASSRAGEELLERAQGARVLIVDDRLLDSLADVRTSQGVMAIVGIPPPHPVPPYSGSYILLDAIADPGNMGTIIRSAAGLGVDGLLLYGDCVDIYNPKCLRSTAGLLPFVRITQIAETDLDCIIAAGAQLLVAEGGHGDSLHDWSPSADCIIAIGNEAHGVCESIRRRATGSLRIPLEAVCESLNAAVAAAIIMYQISKSRRKNFQSLDNLC
jgi:RNA methyltransferase, TrmH family